MIAAVLGHRGLIGNAVDQALQADGWQVRQIGRGPDTAYHLDLATSVNPSPDLFAGCQLLVHCAGVADEEMRHDRRRAFDRAVIGTEAMLRTAVTAGITQLVYISSAHVYGPLIGRLDESSPANPLSDYALAHFLVEQLFRRAAAAAGLSCLILRPCAVYGPLRSLQDFQRWDLIPFGFPAAAVRDGRIVLKSSGMQTRNFVGTDIVAMAIVDWLRRAPRGTELINPIGTADLSVLGLAERCAGLYHEITGMSCPIERPVDVGGPEVPAFSYRSSKVAPRVGVTIDQHIRDLIIRIKNGN
jgi:UDP-glucose 4-epimerase